MLFVWKKEKTEKLIENRTRGSSRIGIISKELNLHLSLSHLVDLRLAV
jgi:hypothetical protein